MRERRGSLSLVLTLKRVVDLVAPLTALVGPGEVCDGDDEEAVRAIGDTSESIVPSQERSHETEGATGDDATALGSRAVVLEIADAEEEEGEVKGEEEGEEGDGGAQGAEQEDEGEDEPAHQVQAEGVEEGSFAELDERRLDLKAAGGEDDGEGDPETSVGGECGGTESVADGHFPHASEKLDETTIAVRQRDDNVGVTNVQGGDVDQGQDESGERES